MSVACPHVTPQYSVWKWAVSVVGYRFTGSLGSSYLEIAACAYRESRAESRSHCSRFSLDGQLLRVVTHSWSVWFQACIFLRSQVTRGTKVCLRSDLQLPRLERHPCRRLGARDKPPRATPPPCYPLRARWITQRLCESRAQGEGGLKGQ